MLVARRPMLFHEHNNEEMIEIEGVRNFVEKD